MATANELMSYRGDAGLGLGSNADIPVSNGKPLDFINNVFRDLAVRDSQKNIIRYNQQINDRDKLMQALSTGAVKVGDILERDQPEIDKAFAAQDKAFEDWMKKGYGDTKGAIAYKKATQEAAKATTQAQARKLFFDKENGVISKEGVPKYAEQRKANLDKNMGNFWSDITPFQETNRLATKPIEEFAQPFTEEFSDPAKPFEKGKRTTFSYDDTLKNASNYSLTPDGLYNLQVFHDTLTELPPVELMDKIKSVNKELERYNTERGLQPGTADYATPIQAVQMPNGQFGINESLDKLAAKFSLAGQQKFKTETFDFDKEKSQRDIALREDQIQKQKIASDNYRERLQQNGANYRANLPYEKMKLTASENPGQEFGNILYGVNADEIRTENGKRLTSNGKPVKLINGAIVNSDGGVAAEWTGDITLPAKALNNSIIAEYNKYAGDKGQIQPDDQGFFVVRFKDGVIDGIQTSDGTYANTDQFQYITSQASQKGVTKYHQPEDISGGAKSDVSGYSDVTPMTDPSGKTIQAGVKNGKWYNIQTGKELK